MLSSNATSNSTLITMLNSTLDFRNGNEFHHCGSNDCQNADVVKDSIDQYLPTNKTAIYILIGILLLMCVLSQILHGLVTPQVYSNHVPAVPIELSTFIEPHRSKQLEDELVPKEKSSASEVVILGAQVPSEV